LERRGLHNIDVRLIGCPDTPVEHGAPSILKELYGISPAHIKDVVRDMLHSESKGFELAH
jgi:1-deoxy-D-xylulose-5-phosphate synthase